MPPEQLWELMWRPETQRQWLGSRNPRWPEPGRRWALRDDAGRWRTAHVVKVKSPESVELAVGPAATWSEDVTTVVTLEVRPQGKRGSQVLVREENVPSKSSEEVSRYWSQILRRLRRLVRRVNRRRGAVRQALVVIHGMGEQLPGATLANLVESGVLPSTRNWVKPDRISGSYELRSVTYKASQGEKLPTTDVFEFYWAHFIRDTTLSQIATWLRRLLLRWRVPAPLRPLWVLAWFIIVSAAGYWLATAFGAESLTQVLGRATVAATVLAVVWRFVGKGLALNILGDAARYLMPHPANVAHRQAIREAGVDLIERLHATGRYDRIVILGHSLGSVIAYDIISHAWAQMHADHRRPARPSFEAVVALESHLDVATRDRTAQKLQHAAWQELRKNTQPWLVTDLVTVGSPLTHADYLMEDSRRAFEAAKAHRVLPTCPPRAETELRSGRQRMTYDKGYTPVRGSGSATFRVLHHAAPFAVTRWTNLYFGTRRLGLNGDLIGGPVAPLFGSWVRDVRLASPTAGVAHTWYWRRANGTRRHLCALRAALRWGARDQLLALLAQMPAFTLVREKRRAPV